MLCIIGKTHLLSIVLNTTTICFIVNKLFDLRAMDKAFYDLLSKCFLKFSNCTAKAIVVKGVPEVTLHY